MSKKINIAIFSKGSREPLHPRIQLELNLLTQQGKSVYLFTAENNKKTLLSKLLNILFFSFFKWEDILAFRKELNNYSHLIIYDSQLLPLSWFAQKNQKVIFETLDNNVELIVYHFNKKLPPLSFLSPLIKMFLNALEKNIVKRNVDKVIVNSIYLKQRFHYAKVSLNFYASPFENITLNQNNSYKPALLYLGKISLDKGITEIIDLGNRFGVKTFVIGDIEKTDFNTISSLIADNTLVEHTNKLDIAALGEKLKSISTNYSLIGTSLVKSVHESYQFQDANKDIDYICLGIPIIGNKRPTTKKIIDDNCGVFFDDFNAIQKLVQNNTDYDLYSNAAKAHYKKKFATEKFEQIFNETLEIN